jgi:hypothetical protein
MPKKQKSALPKVASQAELVTLALFHCRGAEKAVDTEDVAVTAHRIAPSRFSWRKYPDQINLELVRVFLSDAKKVGLVTGSGKTGWRLTQIGLNWAETESPKFSSASTLRSREQSRVQSVDEAHWRRERARIQGTPAWQQWTSGERAITPHEAKKVFRIDSYATGTMRETKVTRLRALFADDAELKPFLDQMASRVDVGGQ